MEEKNEETSHEYNEYLIKIYESLKKKGGKAGKQRQLRADGINTVEKT